jgi:hypothetical protein
MVNGQQQNGWRKKLDSLLNSLFAQQTSKMLRKSFPVAPTAASTKNYSSWSSKLKINIGTLPTNPASHTTAKPTQKAKKRKRKRKKDANFRREAEASKIFPPPNTTKIPQRPTSSSFSQAS